jgi:hypothetical protein
MKKGEKALKYADLVWDKNGFCGGIRERCWKAGGQENQVQL